jgi:hypothetical protein
MMDVPPLFKDFVSDRSIHLLQVRDVGNMAFQNKDNQDFFTTVGEIYGNDGKIDLDSFKAKYPDKEIYWETLAAIGAATGSMELVGYAQDHKGGNLNMCTALENLKLEGTLEGELEGERKGAKSMVEVLRELNIDDDTIIQKVQSKFQFSYKEAQELLS